MKTLMNIGYDTYTADLTGAELESFTKVCGKLTKIHTTRTVNEVEYLVMPDIATKLPVTITLRELPQITEKQYKTMEAAANRANRARTVAEFLCGDTSDEVELVQSLRYYDPGFSYNESKRASVTRGESQIEVHVTTDDGGLAHIVIDTHGDCTRT